MPLVDWFTNQQNFLARQQELAAAVYEYRDTLNRAWREISDFRHELQAAAERLPVAASMGLLTSNALKSGLSAEKAGAISGADVLQLVRNDYQAQLSIADAEYTFSANWIGLNKALFQSSGGPALRTENDLP